METINSNITEDDFLKAKNEYLDLKWKLMLGNFKDQKEKQEIVLQMTKLNKEWEIDEDYLKA